MARRFNLADLPACPDLCFEQPLWAAGIRVVAGLDEAGRGAWAGPVCAGVAVLPPGDASICSRLAGVRDSKQMTPRQRAYWAAEIRAAVLAWGVGFAGPGEIDAMGIVPATRMAMQRALAQIYPLPQHLLLDALLLPGVHLPQTALIKGDARSLSIAAASVLAKTARDEQMLALDAIYPGYGFAAHKGYGTREHLAALQRMGATPVHRRSYAPVRKIGG